MKIASTSAASAIFIFASVSAGEAVARETVTLHGPDVVAERHAEQRGKVALVDGVLCITNNIPTRGDKGWYIRKDVDCQE